MAWLFWGPYRFVHPKPLGGSNGRSGIHLETPPTGVVPNHMLYSNQLKNDTSWWWTIPALFFLWWWVKTWPELKIFKGWKKWPPNGGKNGSRIESPGLCSFKNRVFNGKLEYWTNLWMLVKFFSPSMINKQIKQIKMNHMYLVGGFNPSEKY